MRFIVSIVLFLVLTACSDYNMVEQVEPAEPSDVTDVVPAEPETNEGDTDDTGEPVDPNECSGFLVDQPLGNPNVETDSYATFSLITDSEIEVRQGETAKLQFAVTADNCGDVILSRFTVVQSVIDYTPASWVTDVEHSGEDSTVALFSGEAEFEPIDGYNCNGDDYDAQLFYTWDTEVHNPNTEGAMDEVYVEATTTQIVEFSFAATEYIEPGTTFYLALMDPTWIDVGTGEEVWDVLYYNPEVIKVLVTIVE